MNYKNGIYNLKHRRELLKKLENLDELLNKESGYCVVKEESYYNQDFSKFDIPSKVLENYPLHFRNGQIRVPEITISKYKNVQIVKHQFLIVEEGIISMDSFEELVQSKDQIWYSDYRSCKILNKKYCIPRLYSQKFYIKPNKVNVEVTTPEYLHGDYIFIPAWFSTNICHWLCDVLPRIGFALNYLPQSFKFILPEGTPKTALETLELIGVNKERIIWFNNKKSFKVDNCYVVSRIASQYNFFSDYFFEFYAEIAKKVLPNADKNLIQSKYIYVSRRDSNNRKCINEAELENVLIQKGFDVIILSELSFQERIRIFKEAKIIIGASGAGLVHSVFLSEKSEFIVIGTEMMNQNSNMFARIAKRKNLNFTIFDFPSLDSEDLYASWEVNVKDISDRVNKLLKFLN